jgi:hypothetical protein
VVGVLVCAIAATTLVLTGVARWSGGGAPDGGADAGADLRPVTLPASIGGLRLQEQVLADGGDDTAAIRERLRDSTARTVASLTDTYGAGAGAAAYSDDDLETMAWAMVVRTELPPPTVLPAGPTADDLRLAVVPREVVRSGEVQCLVQNDTVPADQEVTPADRHVLSCQRADAERTVITSFGGSQPTIEYAVRWTDDVWDATRS